MLTGAKNPRTSVQWSTRAQAGVRSQPSPPYNNLGGFRVQGAGFGVQGLGFRFRVSGLGDRDGVWAFGVSGLRVIGMYGLEGDTGHSHELFRPIY